jgi:hypothetical protein
VSVDGNIELTITPADAGLSSFDDGAFSFYNYSQSQVLYGAIEEAQATVSVPDGGSGAILLALGLLPIAITRRLQAKAKR